MEQYHIFDTQTINIIFSQKVVDIQRYNQLIGKESNLVYALINAHYLISLQACLIALYKMLKCKEYKTAYEFQKDLHFLLIPEGLVSDNRLAVTNLQNNPMICIFLTPLNQEQLSCFDLDELTNLYKYSNIEEIIKYYKITEDEIKVDKDIRGAIYNQIVLKKLKI